MSHQKPLPFTKDGYRYFWCEDDLPLCRRYLNLTVDSGKQKTVNNLESYTKRKVISAVVKLSENDRAPQLKLNDACNRITGEKGYSMVRATHGANRGKFYYEVYVDSMPEDTASRIGWSQYYSNLQAPLGYDHFGYSWRSRFGTKFHQARGKTFDKGGGYGQGDTLGCMIELPYGTNNDITVDEHLPLSIKETGYVVKSKKGVPTVFEEQDKPKNINEMKPLVGSKISFYKNGRLVGIAYEDLLQGFYYPSLSLYKNCVLSVNFGPKFKFPPEQYNSDNKNHLNYKPAMDMAEISIIDNFLTDLLYIVDRENPKDGESIKLEDSKKIDVPN